jgi:hypothetical protein
LALHLSGALTLFIIEQHLRKQPPRIQEAEPSLDQDPDPDLDAEPDDIPF